MRRSGRRRIPARALARRVVQPSFEKLAPLTADHPIWRLVGAFKSGGQGPGSSDKHAILDE